jgi:hypothetical protein
VPTQKVGSFIRGPKKKGLEKQSIYSTRFGFLDLYSGKEQKELICPSGYNIKQCFGVMQKLWHGYYKARRDENLESVKKYAKAIQGVQEDMGIKTTSFPHLGLYGDVLVLHNKNDERVVCEDHSEMKDNSKNMKESKLKVPRKSRKNYKNQMLKKVKKFTSFQMMYLPMKWKTTKKLCLWMKY